MAPDRRRLTALLAILAVVVVIAMIVRFWPEPPRMGLRMLGAEITCLSSTMAKR